MSEVCKVILVGESGVGKTCVIVRFISNEYHEGSPSTTGANYASQTLEFKEYKKKLQYDIWDTAGQEKYRGLAKIFYKDASIAILVYDITNRNSFEQIKKYWYEQIKDNSSTNISKIFLFKYINIFY
jgi:small GTP-binding protein